MRDPLRMPYLLEGTYEPEFAKTESLNKQHLQHLRELGPQQVAEYLGSPIYRVLDGQQETLFVEHEELIQYCVELETYNTNGLEITTVTQVSVWRNKDCVLTTGIAAFMFGLLFARHLTIMSDNQQSTDGRRFWASRVVDALTKSNKFVYVIGVSNVGQQLTINSVKRLLHVGEMQSFYSLGEDKTAAYYRFLISGRLMLSGHPLIEHQTVTTSNSKL